MISYKDYEIKKQKVDGIVEEYNEDINQQYKKLETILSDMVFAGYNEGFSDGLNGVIRTYIRLSEYNKDDLIGIFFADTDADETNPIKSILIRLNLNAINTKLDAFDKACKENEKEVSTMLKVSDESGKMYTVVKADEKKEELKLNSQVFETAERINKYSANELLEIFGYAGLPEYRFSQYIMDYSVNQINAKLNEYDSKISMKAEQAKVSSETLEKFAKCIVEGGTEEEIERKLREIFLNN